MSEHKNFEDDIRIIRDLLSDINEQVKRQDKKIQKLESMMSMSDEDNVQISHGQSVPPPPPAPEEIKKSEIDERSRENLEERIGGQWFAKLGVVVLLIGLAFFLKYAFDNDWINEYARVVMGLLAGTVLILFGEKYANKYQRYSQVMTGGGIAMLYLSIYAALNFYALVDHGMAFLLMIAITAIAIFLAMRRNAMWLMIMAIFGAFLTPILVSSGVNNQLILFGYLFIIDLAILLISFLKKWPHLNKLAFFGTFILLMSWGSQFYSSDQLFSTIFFLSIFFLIFSVSALSYNVFSKEKSSGPEQLLVLANGIAYFATVYFLMNEDYHAFMGLFAVIVSAYHFVLAYLIRTEIREDKNLYDFLAILGVAFLTLAIPIQFKEIMITVFWIIEAVALTFIGISVHKKLIFVSGLAISLFAAFRTLTIDAWMDLPDNALVVINERFIATVFLVLGFIILYFILKYAKRAKDLVFPVEELSKASGIMIALANFFVIFGISLEISFYYNFLMDNYVWDSITDLVQAESITLSIFWMLYAIGLMIYGFGKRNAKVRLGGIILLAFSISKLFFYDLWSLGSLYRIISSISLGIVLVSISFVYQKYKHRLKDII